MGTAQPTSKQIINQFYTRKRPGAEAYVCECGKTVKGQKNGFTNLLNHIRNHHADHLEIFTRSFHSNAELTGILAHFSPKKGRNVFGWMEKVILKLRPFSIVEDKIERKYCNLSPICTKTFISYMRRLVGVVEGKVTARLPEKFALVFDGWSCGSTHYLAVFASVPAENEHGFEYFMLTMSPFQDETSLDANEHLEFLTSTLELYGKNWSNVVALVGDNCAVNKSLSTKARVPFIGCASHRFNLAVKDILKEHEEFINRVQRVMVMVRTLTTAGKLRAFTELRGVLNCPTRWGAAYKMLLRYQQIREYLPQLNMDNVDEAMLNGVENRKLDDLCRKLENLHSVNLTVQQHDSSMSRVRVLFDGVCEAYPQLLDRLNSDADIVHCPDFESGIVCLQDGKADFLTSRQQNALKLLMIENQQAPSSYGTEGNKPESFAQRLLKRRRLSNSQTSKKYMNTRFLVPTSNVVESLFSHAGHALTDQRRNISPIHLEDQIFLYRNAHLWNLDDVSNLV